MSRITILDGYGAPRRRRHHHRKHRKHRSYGGQKSKMKHCAVQWRRGKHHGKKSYRAFMRWCLKK